jgi:hypothetical protein
MPQSMGNNGYEEVRPDLRVNSEANCFPTVGYLIATVNPPRPFDECLTCQTLQGKSLRGLGGDGLSAQ